MKGRVTVESRRGELHVMQPYGWGRRQYLGYITMKDNRVAFSGKELVWEEGKRAYVEKGDTLSLNFPENICIIKWTS